MTLTEGPERAEQGWIALSSGFVGRIQDTYMVPVIGFTAPGVSLWVRVRKRQAIDTTPGLEADREDGAST